MSKILNKKELQELIDLMSKNNTGSYIETGIIAQLQATMRYVDKIQSLEIERDIANETSRQWGTIVEGYENSDKENGIRTIYRPFNSKI